MVKPNKEDYKKGYGINKHVDYQEYSHMQSMYGDYLEQQNKDLKEYAKHEDTCADNRFMVTGDCTCGLDKLLNN